MTDVLEVIGLVALVVSGLLVAVWLGVAVFGAACLLISYVATARKRKAAEEVAARAVAVRTRQGL